MTRWAPRLVIFAGVVLAAHPRTGWLGFAWVAIGCIHLPHHGADA